MTRHVEFIKRRYEFVPDEKWLFIRRRKILDLEDELKIVGNNMKSLEKVGS